MPLNFPSNPSTGTQYASTSGITYVYDGRKWIGKAQTLMPGTNAITNNGYVVQVTNTGSLMMPVGKTIVDENGDPILTPRGYTGSQGSTSLGGQTIVTLNTTSGVLTKGGTTATINDFYSINSLNFSDGTVQTRAARTNQDLFTSSQVTFVSVTATSINFADGTVQTRAARTNQDLYTYSTVTFASVTATSINFSDGSIQTTAAKTNQELYTYSTVTFATVNSTKFVASEGPTGNDFYGYTFSTDPNTGMYSPSEEIIEFAVFGNKIVNYTGAYEISGWSPSITFYSTVFPSEDIVFDLGRSDYRWNKVYANQVLLNNTGTSTGTFLVSTATNGLEISNFNKVSLISQAYSLSLGSNGRVTYPDGTTSTGSIIYVPHATTSSYKIITEYDDGMEFIPLAFEVIGNTIKLPSGNGNIQSGNSEEFWKLDSANGEFGFPNGSRINYGRELTALQTGTLQVEIIGLEPGHDPEFSINMYDTSQQWRFKQNGSLIFPDGTTQTTAFSLTTLSNVTYANITSTGALTINQTKETYKDLTGATGVVTHDCSQGQIFYHTNVANSFTVNLTNLTLPNNYATNVTLVINQGATPYIANALQVGGNAQTIYWQGSLTEPTGNAFKVDVMSFSLVSTGTNSYLVLGQLVSYG